MGSWSSGFLPNATFIRLHVGELCVGLPAAKSNPSFETSWLCDHEPESTNSSCLSMGLQLEHPDEYPSHIWIHHSALQHPFYAWGWSEGFPSMKAPAHDTGKKLYKGFLWEMLYSRQGKPNLSLSVLTFWVWIQTSYWSRQKENSKKNKLLKKANGKRKPVISLSQEEMTEENTT